MATNLPVGRPLHILYLGDSISDGAFADSPPNGMLEMRQLLDAAGVAYQLHNGSMSGQGTLGVINYVQPTIKAAAADLVLFNIGTNDAINNGFEARYGQVLQAMWGIQPAVAVVPAFIQYSRVPPAPTWLYANEPQINDAIYRNVINDTGTGYRYPAIIGLADFQVVPNGVDWLPDGMHPSNDLCQPVYAQIWYRAFADHYGLPQIPAPPGMTGHRPEPGGGSHV